MRIMRRPIKNMKILWAIVIFFPINVMYDFFWKKMASQQGLGNKPMLIDITISLCAWMARIPFQNVSRSVFFESPNRSFKCPGSDKSRPMHRTISAPRLRWFDTIEDLTLYRDIFLILFGAMIPMLLAIAGPSSSIVCTRLRPTFFHQQESYHICGWKGDS